MEIRGLMNKKEIIFKLKNINLDLNEIIVISGASLVVQDIIDNTVDIDLSCSEDYYKKIKWEEKLGDAKKNIKYYDVFEIANNFYYPDKVVIIDGIKFMNLKECLKVKEELNRPKDREVILKLRKRMKHNGKSKNMCE